MSYNIERTNLTSKNILPHHYLVRDNMLEIYHDLKSPYFKREYPEAFSRILDYKRNISETLYMYFVWALKKEVRYLLEEEVQTNEILITWDL